MPGSSIGRRDALTHFLQSGQRSWANPHPLFDCEAYLDAHPDAANRGANPLLHFLRAQPGENSSTEGGYFGAA